VCEACHGVSEGPFVEKEHGLPWANAFKYTVCVCIKGCV
jgi:hypothetical protein